MLIQELLLNEVMESGFPFRKLSPTSWAVTVPGSSTNTGSEVTVVVDTPHQTIGDTVFMELSFRIPGSTSVHLEDIFKGTAVFKLFNSIVEITEQCSADIIVFIPNDMEVQASSKKARVYMAVMRRMKTRGLLARIEEVVDPSGHVFQFCFPSTSKALLFDNSELQQIAVEYFSSKV
jgi:hypothetical protein